MQWDCVEDRPCVQHTWRVLSEPYSGQIRIEVQPGLRVGGDINAIVVVVVVVDVVVVVVVVVVIVVVVIVVSVVVVAVLVVIVVSYSSLPSC